MRGFLIPTLLTRAPIADLDFAGGRYRLSGVTDGDPSRLPGYSFTRASTGYAEDLSGNLISFASGAPRITNKGVLIEEARTNLQVYSQDFSGTGWTLSQASLASTNNLAPDNTLTATKLAETAVAGSSHSVNNGISKAASAIAYSASVYVKQAERTWCQIALYDGGTLGTRVWFNLATGVVGTTQAIGAGFTSVSASIQPAANGYYRCIVNATSSTATSIQLYIYAATGDTVLTYNGVAGSGIYIWGAQVEAGAFPTSYIPTTSGSATRAADVFNITGLSSAFASAFTLYAAFGANAAAFDARALVISDGSTNNRIGLGRNSTNLRRAFAFSGGASAYDQTGAAVTGAAVKAAAAYGDGVFTPYFNGSALTAAASALPSGMNQLSIGSQNGSNPINEYVSRVSVFAPPYSVAQLQALTAA